VIEKLRFISSIILGIAFLKIGIDHFLDPQWFEPIVPEILGFPRFWVLASGAVEIVIGIMLIFPVTQKIGGKSCAILLIILYWANVNMWINDIPIGGQSFEGKWHLLRLFIQLLLIGIALFIGGIFPKRYDSEKDIPLIVSKID
tara:strand:+ start:10113 stop:10544 length:432 start_codon:yes stop_codon:yes gene_type:complete